MYSAGTHTEAGSGVAEGARGGAAGLEIILWAYSLALVAAGCLPQLPSLAEAAVFGALLLLVSSLLPVRTCFLPLAIAVVAGSGWGLWHNHAVLQDRLPPSQHGSDFFLPVQVISLPEVRRGRALYGPSGEVTSLRFSVRVLAPLWAGSRTSSLVGRKLDLTWYHITPEFLAQVRGGSRWELPVRLKRPRGSVNPHGFDYEGWLLRRGIYATGYVRLKDAQPRWLGDTRGLAAMRHRLRDRLMMSELPRAGVLSALLLGDRSGLSDDERQLLRRTGTAHLLAISGLHVGMVAAFCLLLGGALGRLWGMLRGRTPTGFAFALALSGTGTYTLLVGVPLSAQRALVMTWIALSAWQLRRRLAPGLAFSAALAAVLTLQPLAFYSPGFWLSFIAVAALLLAFGRRQRIARGADHLPGRLSGRLGRAAGGLLRSQWVISLALLLPSLFYFSGFSLGGLLLNLLAIPWMGLLILPALMLGALAIGTGPGDMCLRFAGWQLDLLLSLLSGSDRLLPGWHSLGAPAEPALLLLVAGSVLLLLLPRGLPGRHLGWLFVVPLLSPLLAGSGTERGLRITVLDVGQGLATVVRAPGLDLVYDAGPLSGTSWSAGSATVAPFLLGVGAREVNDVILSHGDRDHAGGLAGLAETIDIQRLVAPGRLPERLGRGVAAERATFVRGRRDTLGSVELRWLWPESLVVSGEENDHSCVALLQWRGVRVLFAGDISAAVEQQLVERYPDFQPVDLLIAPHHGSRTSSSTSFINWARPMHVIFSAGYRHRFGHPHPDVVDRYRAVGAHIWNTAESGAVTFSWRDSGKVEVQAARDSGPFWYRTENK